MRQYKLKKALDHTIWRNHKPGDLYKMDGRGEWKIAYYPIFENGKTGESYTEPRALVEQPKIFKGEEGIDFREVPLRFLEKI